MGVMAEAKRYLRLAVVMMGAVVLSTAALRADAADSSAPFGLFLTGLTL